jgi:hypothetical protein
MLAEPIFERLKGPEFRPFTLVLADGKRVLVRDRDCSGFPCVDVRGKRFFSSSMTVLEVRNDEMVAHCISLSRITEIIDAPRVDGAEP